MKSFHDDGRTVAEMNIEGMPWYSPRKIVRKKEKHENTGGRMALMPSILAALAASGIFILAAALFIVFCINVWLR